MAKVYIVTNSENDLEGTLSDATEGKVKISWTDESEDILTNEELEALLESEKYTVAEADGATQAQNSIQAHSTTTAPGVQADGNPKTRLEWIMKIIDGLGQVDMESLESMHFAMQQAQIGGEAARAGIGDGQVDANRATIAAKPSDAMGKGFVKTESEKVFNEMELTEEGKVKISTLFEVAVASTVAPKLVEMQEKFDTNLEEGLKGITENLIEKINLFLDHVVKEFMEENKIAMESSLRSQLTEEFIGKLKDLFVENYIDIPEDKVEVLENIVIENDNLTNKLNEKELAIIENEKIIKGLRKTIALNEASASLTLVQKTNFEKLSEGIEFDTTEDFSKKIIVIKENVLKIGKNTGIDLVNNETKVDTDTKKVITEKNDNANSRIDDIAAQLSLD